jgi:hypothetical protein
VRRTGAALLLLLVAAPCQAQIYTRVNRNGVVEATNVPAGPDFRLTYPGKGTLIHSRGFRRAYSGEYDSHIEAASALHGVPNALVRAVIEVESEFDRYAVSSKGAQGLMQLMPPTARRLGVLDPFDARQNIFAGVQYLRLLLDLFQGDVELALAAYNAGENAVLRFNGVPPYRETRSYVDRVRALFDGLRPVSFTPRTPTAPRPSPAAPPAPVKPARPAAYYRFKDERGVLHVTQDPPPEGVPYTMFRASAR